MDQFLSEHRMAYHYHEGSESMVSSASLDFPRALRFERESTYVLSAFGKLPVELTYQILSILDFKSLISFKNASWSTLELVNSLPAFRDIMAHAPSALRAFADTNTLSCFTAPQIARALYSDECAKCRNFGPYLYLPTCERCCYTCLDYSGEISCFNTIAMDDAQDTPQDFGLSVEALRSLPKVSLIHGLQPGESGVNISGKPTQKATQLVSLSTIQSLGGNSPATTPSSEHDDPFAASTPFLSLNRQSKVLQSGIWCRGCEDTWIRSVQEATEGAYEKNDAGSLQCTNSLRAFSMDGFLQHLSVCSGAKDLQDLYDSGENDSTIQHRRDARLNQ